MARVLVTGADGFIGRRLLASLWGGEHEVTALTRKDGDIRDARTFDKLKPVGQVFHLAARSFVPDSWKDPAAFHETNVIGTQRVVDYCRRTGATLTFVSSYLYGDPERLPLDEDAPVRPNNPYALSKHLAEAVCRFHSQTTEQPVYIIRPFNIYGPGQRADFLIPKVIAMVKAGVPITVENLAPRRDYLYIDDFVAGLMATMMPGEGCRVFNFGSGHSYSVREVIDAIQAAAGTDLPIISEEKVRPNEIADVRADNRRARHVLCWQPRTTFSDGIRRTIDQTGDQGATRG